MKLDAAILAAADADVQAEIERRKTYSFAALFPDCQPSCDVTSLKRADHAGLCRLLYRKHVAFMAEGARYQSRCFMAANRIGKSLCAAYEVTCHLTGLYPHWWVGRRFEKPGDWIAAGNTGVSTRDVSQVALMGPLHAPGTGLIPSHLIVEKTARSGTPDAFDTIFVRHTTGGIATIQFRSYDQGREKFQGTKRQGVWEDEEPPEDVADEIGMRMMTEDGIEILTFTPLMGITPFVKSYLETADLYTDDGQVLPAEEWLNAA